MELKEGDIVTVTKKYPSNGDWTWVDSEMDKCVGQSGKIVICFRFIEKGKHINSYQIKFDNVTSRCYFREECLFVGTTLINF